MRTPNRSQRLTDLVSTVETLYPDASVKIGLVSGRRNVQFRLVPGPRSPRMLVPTGSTRAAANSVDRPSANDTVWRSAPRQVLSGLLTTKLGSAAMPFGLSVSPVSDSISDYLQEALGEPTLISLTVGSARANRKPILNIHRSDGTEIGFAKIGLSSLTNQLVKYERTVLQLLEGRPPAAFSVPKVLHHGVWRDHEVLIMSSLRPDRPQPKRSQVPLAAAAQIAAMTGIQVIPIGSSPWLARLSAEIDQFRGTEDGMLAEMFDRFLELFGEIELPFGSWHGDFGAWNFARTSTVPMIWDWERFSADIPVGSDIVHYLSHQALRQSGDVGAAREALERVNPTLSALLRQGSATTAITTDPLTLKAIKVSYLLTIATRFTADSATALGQPVQSLARWHHRVIADQLQARDSKAPIRNTDRKKLLWR